LTPQTAATNQFPTRFDLKLFRLGISLCSLFLTCVAFAAETPPPSGSSLTTNPVFETNCAKCHGKNAEGRHFGGPSLVSEKAAAIPVDHLRSIITNGKGHMPRYTGKLTDAEIDTLVQQIKALNTK
jgi:mono/diheme cytochrome c family protein